MSGNDLIDRLIKSTKKLKEKCKPLIEEEELRKKEETKRLAVMDEDDESGGLAPMVLVGRADWGAADPTGETPTMATPAHNIVIDFLTGTELTDDQDECKEIMVNLQKTHMEDKGFLDIAYNFVIGGDGQVYEGRGWGKRPETLVYPEFDGTRVDIGYMGDQNCENLPFEMYKSCLQLIKQGVKRQYITEEYNCAEHPLMAEAVKQEE